MKLYQFFSLRNSGASNKVFVNVRMKCCIFLLKGTDGNCKISRLGRRYFNKTMDQKAEKGVKFVKSGPKW